MKATASIRDIAELIGVSERTAHSIRKRPDFPAPVDLGLSARTRWRTDDVLAWLKSLPARSMQTEPERLKSGKARRRAEQVPA